MKTKENNNIYTKTNKIVSMILLAVIIFIHTVTLPIKTTAEGNYTGLKLVAGEYTTLNVGDKITVIVATEGEAIGSIDAYLHYDLETFELLTKRNVTEIASDWGCDQIKHDEELYGKNTGYLIASNSNGDVNTGELIEIQFTLKKQVTSATITMDEIHITDNNNDDFIQLGSISCEFRIAAQQSTLTVNPNGGTWKNSTEPQTITQDEGTELDIPNPTVPLVGNKIVYNPNGGEVSKLQENQPLEFSGWTGATITDGKYTFGSTNETITANYTTDAVTLPTPTKAGSRFLGWYTEQTGGTKIGDAGANYAPTYTRPNQEITLFAQWQKDKYTLTINPNGGTYNGVTSNSTIQGTCDSTTAITEPTPPTGATITLDKNDGTGTRTTEIQTQSFNEWVKTGEGSLNGIVYTFGAGTGTLTATYTKNPVNLGTSTRTGYTFDGWYTQAVDGAKIENPNAYPAERDITLYAHWNPNKYEIEFNPNGGTVNETTREVTYDSKYGILPTPIKPGHTFNGWKLPDGTEVTKDSIVKITEKTILTAQWQEKQYELTINPNGGKYNGTTNVSKENGKYGDIKTLQIPEAPDDGYTVTLNLNYTGATAQNPIKQTKTFSRWIKESGEGSINNNTYTFGEGNGQVKAEYTANNVQLPTSIERRGYTFNGWYTQAVDGTKIETPNSYNPTSDITLYAHWTPKKFTITFEPGKGTIDETKKEKEVTYDEPYGELPTPTRPGYDFDGWKLPDGAEVTEDDIVDLIEDTTLTAKWLGTTYTVNFDYAGGTGTVESKQVRNEGTYGELPNATKEGYTFTGWYDETGNKITQNTTVNLSSDITLHARYEINEYTVTFKNDDGTTIKTVTAEHGSKVEFDGQTPTKNNTPTGYEAIFNGWTGIENLESVTSDTTVTAKYTLTPIEYTITYENIKNSDISNTTKFPTSYTVKDLDIQLENLPNQGKLIFDGWYTTDDENGEKVTSIDISKLGNITLYARWKQDKLWLKSDVYKIGENDIDNYEEGDIYLEKIMPETTVAQFIKNCKSNGEITVINQDKEVLEDDDLVGTNMTIKVTRYDEEITLTAVVMGDLDGNGIVTVTDLSGINQTVLKVIKLEGAIFKAADLDDNNEITVTDLSGENQKILKTIEFKYDKKAVAITNLQ